MKTYTDFGYTQEPRLNAAHPKVSGKWAKDKGLWDGRRVAVKFLHARGSYKRATDMRVVYGVLSLDSGTGRTDQIAVVDSKTGEKHVIHVSRAKVVWDLTRTLAAKS